MHDVEQMSAHNRENFVNFIKTYSCQGRQSEYVYVERFKFCWIMRNDASTFAYLTILSTKLGPHKQALHDTVFPGEFQQNLYKKQSLFY